VTTVDFFLLLSAVFMASAMSPATARNFGWACLACAFGALAWRVVP